MTTATDLHGLLGPASPSEQFLHELVSDILNRDTVPLDRVVVTRAEPVPYDFGSPATGALVRLGGTVDGADWSVFVKVLQNPRHWRRTDLLDLAARIPALLDLADKTPQALPHGDASPQNLLVPRGEPDTFVAIDIAFQTPHAIGFDLAQLLVGLAHAGQLPASALPAIDADLVPSFANGARNGQRPADAGDIETGYLATLALRSGFTSLPLRDLDADPAVMAERCALTRFILDRTRHLGR